MAAFHQKAMARSLAVCGVVVIDGTKATLGSTIEDQIGVQKVGQVTNLALSRTRRGGSSASRFARKRDGANLGFLRRVVEEMHHLLTDAGAFIVGGKADMKHKLIKEMPLSLRSKVQLVVPYDGDSDEAGLRALARHGHVVWHQAHMHDSSTCLQEFASRYERPGDSLCCWGPSQTLMALRMGAVQCLLLADSHCDGAGSEDLRSLAHASGASVFKIMPDTEAGALFCKGFCIGGILRWSMDLDDLEAPSESSSEDEMSRDKQEDAMSVASTADTANDSWVQSASAWMAQRLSQSLGDGSSAEALSACAEVLLACDAEPIEDRIIGVVELLREQGVQELILQEFVAELSIQYD